MVKLVSGWLRRPGDGAYVCMELAKHGVKLTAQEISHLISQISLAA